MKRIMAVLATMCGNGRPVLCVGAGAAALMESVQRYAAKTASLRAKLFSRDEGADSEAFESSTRASILAARMVDEKRRSALKGSGVDSHGVVVVDDDDADAGNMSDNRSLPSLKYPLLVAETCGSESVSHALRLLAQRIA